MNLRMLSLYVSTDPGINCLIEKLLTCRYVQYGSDAQLFGTLMFGVVN